MISALEVGLALCAPLLVLAWMVFQPRPKPVRIRTRDAHSRRHPDA